MPVPVDTSLSRVRVSTTSGGTYTSIGYTRSFDYTEGSEGATRLPYFGGEALRAGDPTLSGTIPVWFSRTDTSGQEILRTAKRDGTTVWIQICPEGTSTGAKVEQFEALVTELSISSDSDGDAVEGSFSYEGDPSTLTTVTLS